MDTTLVQCTCIIKPNNELCVKCAYNMNTLRFCSVDLLHTKTSYCYNNKRKIIDLELFFLIKNKWLHEHVIGLTFNRGGWRSK